MTPAGETQAVRSSHRSEFGCLAPTAVAIGLVALTIVAFRPALENDFVTWDDDLNFLQNHHFRGLGWSQIGWAWTTFHLGSYQPLAWMILSAEFSAWGLDPRGYHAVSLLLHAATVVALYALTLELLRSSGFEPGRFPALAFWAGLAVASYAVHPLRVEAVAWASCQPYLLCALFAVLSVLTYLRACRSGPGPRRRWLNAALVLYGLSLFSKAPAVGLPAVLLILDYYPLRRLGGHPGQWFGRSVRPVWLEKARFMGLSIVASAAAYLSKVMTIVDVQPATSDILSRGAVACYGVCFYVLKTIVPRDVSAYYLVPGPVTWTRPLFAASFVALAGLSVGFFLLRRNWPGLLASWVALLAIQSPVSGIVSLGIQQVASRYTYLPAMALVTPIAAGLIRMAAALRRRRCVALGMVGLGVILCLVHSTRELCRSWHDSETLWTHALAHGAGRSMLVYNNLGTVYHDRGQIDRAIATYRAALEHPFEPAELTSRAFILYNLGSCLEERGEVEQAVVPFGTLVRLVPQIPDAHYRLGRVFALRGKVEEATLEYLEALRLNPRYTRARIALQAVSSDPNAVRGRPSRP